MRRVAALAVAIAGLAVAIAGLAACRHVPAPPAPLRVVVFPVQNASGGPAPVRALHEALENALAARGVQLAPRKALDAALAAHRIRWTAGVGKATARVLREELGADVVAIPMLEVHEAGDVPRTALSVRMVSTGDRPRVLWADAVARSGDDAPGLLSLGLITRSQDLQDRVVAALAASVDAWVERSAAAELCGEAGRFTPRRVFRAPVLDDLGRRTVAILPFTNETRRRGAADVLQAQFVAQLARAGTFEVLDPGFVREQLLEHRIVLEEGVSVDNALVLSRMLAADLVLSGFVHVFQAPASRSAAPRIEFSAYALDSRSEELVWSSTSAARGDDGVFWFDAGKVRTSAGLSCRMVRGVVDRLVGEREARRGSD